MLVTMTHDLFVVVCSRVRLLITVPPAHFIIAELPPLAPLPSAVDCYDKTITLCGLSKSWGLPGLRVGWIASQAQQVLQQVLALKDYTTICSSAPSEVRHPGGAQLP